MNAVGSSAASPLFGRHDFNRRLPQPPVRVRYRWTELQSGAPGGDQAYSVDDGQSWETNGVMSFTRLAEEPR